MRKNIFVIGLIIFIIGIFLFYLSSSESIKTFLYGTNQYPWTGIVILGFIMIIVGLILRNPENTFENNY